MPAARALLPCLLAAAFASADGPAAAPAIRFVHDDCVLGVAWSRARRTLFATATTSRVFVRETETRRPRVGREARYALERLEAS